MKTRIAVKVKKEILRIRLDGDVPDRLEAIGDEVNMTVPELAKYVMGAVSRCKPHNFHRAVAAMVEDGNK